MGIFQEAAIIAGDLISQPIRKKAVELFTGQKVRVRKVVEEGAFMDDGSILPNLDLSGAIGETIKRRKSVLINNFHAKRVHWELEHSEEK